MREAEPEHKLTVHFCSLAEWAKYFARLATPALGIASLEPVLRLACLPCQGVHDPLELISRTLAAVGCPCDGASDHRALPRENGNLAAGSRDASDFRACSGGHLFGKNPAPQGSGHSHSPARGGSDFGFHRLDRFRAVG